MYFVELLSLSLTAILLSCSRFSMFEEFFFTNLLMQALIDGPQTGVARQAVNLGHVVLTPLTFTLPRGARTATVSKKWAAAGVTEKWGSSAWAKKIAQRETRAALSDFERFQVMVLRKQRRYAVKKAVAKA